MSKWINPEYLKCCKCGSKDTYIKPDGTEIWHRYYNKYGIWDNKSRACHECWKDEQRSNTHKIREKQIERKKCAKCGINEVCAKGLCKTCYSSYYYHNVEKIDPDSSRNIKKSLANSRTGNLGRHTENGKSVIGQWIGAKTLGLKDLNIEKNNFAESIDLSPHPELGNIGVMTKTSKYGEWPFGYIENLSFDNLLTLCMDNNKLWRCVEMAYIIPVCEFRNRSGFSIIKNPSRITWYHTYRVDEKPFDDIYRSVDIPEFFNPFDLWNGKYDKDRKRSG